MRQETDFLRMVLHRELEDGELTAEHNESLWCHSNRQNGMNEACPEKKGGGHKKKKKKSVSEDST